MLERTEDASDAAEFSCPPSAWLHGVTACFRGTVVTDRSTDWHVMFHYLEPRVRLRTSQIFPAGLECPIPSHTVLSQSSKKQHVLVKTRLEYRFQNRLVFGKGEWYFRGLSNIQINSMSHLSASVL